MTTRVAVNGHGVIGKRVADAVLTTPGMGLVGVADVASDWHVQAAPRWKPTVGVRACLLPGGLSQRPPQTNTVNAAQHTTHGE